MQRALQHLEHLEQCAAGARAGGGRGGLGLQHRLGELEVPVAELVPGELVKRGGGIVETVFGESLLDRLDSASEARADPTIGYRKLHAFRVARGSGVLPGIACTQDDEARGIPQLVAEVAVTGHAREVEADV